MFLSVSMAFCACKNSASLTVSLTSFRKRGTYAFLADHPKSSKIFVLCVFYPFFLMLDSIQGRGVHEVLYQ